MNINFFASNKLAIFNIILKKTFNIFLLAFYAFGTSCLPLGDFSFLRDIPQMYSQCKAIEDKDMTAFDFITDHLLNIDGLFDQHENGDPQKPHHPMQYNHHAQVNFSLIPYFVFSVTLLHPDDVKTVIPFDNSILSDYTSVIFRPPISA